MSKALTIAGLIVSALLLLLFGLDLALGIPFGKPSLTMDIGFLICGLALAYMSWTTYRELT